MNAVLSPESAGRPPLAIPPNYCRSRCLYRERDRTKSAGRRRYNLQTSAISQAWFSTGDAKLVRDLMRDLERVNCGELERTDFFIRIETYV